MSTGSIGFLMKIIHWVMDIPFRNLKNLEILEVGAGNGEHLSQCKLDFSLYVQSDIRLNSNLFVADNSSFVISDAEKLSEFKDLNYDLLIATCLLAHLDDMYTALENWRRVIKPNGFAVIYVPCEPGIFLRICRFFSTRRKIQGFGFNHAVLHWREHRNHFMGMRTAIRHTFRDSKIFSLRLPFPFLPWELNLFQIYWIQRKVS